MKRLLFSLTIGMSLFGASSNQNTASSLIELTEVQTRNNERLFHDGSSFLIQHMGRMQEIPSYAINRDIRSHNIATLLSLQQHGYFDVQRSVGGDEYRIDFQPRLKAGGPKLAVAVGWLSRAILNGVVWMFVGRSAERVINQGGNFAPVMRAGAGLALRNAPSMVPGSIETAILAGSHPRSGEILDAAAPVVSLVITANPAATLAWIEVISNGLSALALLLPTP